MDIESLYSGHDDQTMLRTSAALLATPITLRLQSGYAGSRMVGDESADRVIRMRLESEALSEIVSCMSHSRSKPDLLSYTQACERVHEDARFPLSMDQ